MNIALTPELEGLIRERVESGRYHSPEERVRKALLLLEARERHLEELRHETQKGIDSGAPVEADEVFARLRAKYEAMAAERES
jgi:antitoxin ParD1/3/4